MSVLRGVDVLVTGATGFLGSHLTRRLVREGARVHVLTRPSSSLVRLDGIITAVTRWNADLRDATVVDRCLEAIRPRVIFHLAGITAARDPELTADPVLLRETYEVNLMGTLTLTTSVLRVAGPTVRIVRSGGLEEYGAGPLPYREGQREAPVSTYSASQVAATHVLQMLWRQHRLPVVTLRPAVLYGPHQSDTFFIPALIRACIENRSFEMTSGEQTRDYLYVADAADAFVRAATAPGVDGDIVNVGSGREYRIRDVGEAVVRLAGSGKLLIGSLPSRAGSPDRLVCDPSRAGERLGWYPRTSLDDGLRRCIAWHKSAIAERCVSCRDAHPDR